MVDAARHLLYVSPEMRDMWLNFWQEAQYIYREAMKEQDVGKRPAALCSLIEEQIRAAAEPQISVTGTTISKR